MDNTRQIHINKQNESLFVDDDDDDASSCDEQDERVPPGAIRSLRNKMQYQFYELTGDANDELLNKPRKFIMPSSFADVKNFKEAAERTSKTGLKNAVAFSHLTGSGKEFESTECIYSPNTEIHPIVDGVVMDSRSAELLKGGDLYLDVNAEGNILSIHLMREGWVENYHRNAVCNRCGAFPSYGRCFDCGGGSFCSPECAFLSKNDGTHSPKACLMFVKKRVEIANPIIVKKNESDRGKTKSTAKPK